MEIQTLITKKRSIYSSILDFLESSNDLNDDFQLLVSDFEKIGLQNNTEQSIISKNHYRLKYFFDKIFKLLEYLLKILKTSITNLELFNIFRQNKRILLFLFEKNILTPDNEIVSM